MTRPSSNRVLAKCVCVLILLLPAPTSWAYESAIHQRLTFIAAQQFNNCVSQMDLPLPVLTPLQVRYMARTNVQQAQGNFFSRLFRWNYYNRANQQPRSFLWLIDTRFHDHFVEVERRLREPKSDVAFYRDLGRVVNYVQTVTSPAHAVPVYTARWWRLSVTDRFDEQALDVDAVNAAVATRCNTLHSPPEPYAAILGATADGTLTAVQSGIDGMPATWEAFWRFDRKDSNFGDYGRAGNNFGRATEFRCGEQQRCVLLDGDPLYRQFAQERHVEAVIGTMRTIHTALENAEHP